ncbi:MAG TPA: pyridoxal-phosphate dependent enzyme [Vicinamibacterales bacterium]|nr:pyridoxal-phosphate dependent enzyme [Vicinamibacterales bacterium]
MKISDLHNFVTVAQAKSFSRAAETLYRTPPAISASIKRLEREVGMTLLDRGSPRGPTLTTEGIVLYDYARRLLELRDDARKALEGLCGGRQTPEHAFDESEPLAANVVRDAMRSGIYDLARETPLEAAPRLTARLGCEVLLKRDDLQPGFSFKIRGAHHRMRKLSAAERFHGVVAASAGNHAQGVALSARHLGIDALIVMPRSTPRIKVDAVRAFGAAIELAGDTFEEALAHARVECQRRGAIFIHAFDDLDVIAGQATVGLEIARQCPAGPVDVYVPVGGGGLIAGVAAALKQLRPDAAVIGVEPAGSDSFARAMEAGGPVALDRVDPFADGVAVREVGRLAFAVARSNVDRVVRVTNSQICGAMRDVFEDCRVLVEPSGALALAGLIACSGTRKPGRAIAIVTGANVDFESLPLVVRESTSGA